MDLRTIAHKGLKRLILEDKAAGVPAAYRAKIETIIGFLLAAPNVEAVQKLQSWKAHQLTGNRSGTWSLAVSRNWRVTFKVNADNEIEDLNLEDYH